MKAGRGVGGRVLVEGATRTYGWSVMRGEQGKEGRGEIPRALKANGEFGLYPGVTRDSWEGFKWRHFMIRFVLGDHPSGFSSENGGKGSQLETGSSVKIKLQ